MMKLRQHLADRLKSIDAVVPVFGGEIGSSFQIQSKGKSYFCKIYEESNHEAMVRSELDGLSALHDVGLSVPEVIDPIYEVAYSALLMEYIEIGVQNPKAGGEAIANLHQVEGHSFGYSKRSFIGTKPIPNTLYSNWADFWWEYRIWPLYKEVFPEANDFIRKGMHWVERNRGTLFPNESPRLLHGDLWSGNFIYSQKMHPYFIDPSVYYGHREMDIGMMFLFGGFRNEFRVYQEIMPLAKGWESRLFWSQLYPLLVHWCLFGGTYAMRIEQGFKEKGITT